MLVPIQGPLEARVRTWVQVREIWALVLVLVLVLVLILVVVVVPERAWFRARVQVEQPSTRSPVVLPLFLPLPSRLDHRPNLVLGR